MRFYENPKFLQENRLPQRSYYIPKNDGAYMLLNGEWNFKYFKYDDEYKKDITCWDKIPVSLHCWQGDDVTGFDHVGPLTGGIQTTGLNGNLDKVWKNVKDLSWIGGSSESWERGTLLA